MSQPLIPILLLAVSIYAQAVTYGIALYNNFGAPVEIQVKIEPGDGSVKINGLTHYDELLHLSTIVACWEAAIASGRDPFAYNYTIYINPLGGSRAIVGPSLSLSIAVATYGAFVNTTINSSVVFTGTVAPGGVVDFVGGVREKALGAKRGNFTLFVYPVLQYYDYKFVLRPKLIGVYGSLVQVLEKKPQNLTEIIPVEEVGNIYQAFAVAINKPYNMTQNLERLDSKIQTLKTATPTEKLRLLEGEVLRVLNNSLKLALKYKDYRDLLTRGMGTAEAYLKLGRENIDIATEAYPRALREALNTYYFVRLMTESDAAIIEMRAYTDALIEIAERLLPNITSDNLCDSSYSYMYTAASKFVKSQAEKYLRYFQIFKDPGDAVETAYRYAETAYLAWKAILYSRPGTGLLVDVNATAQRLSKYLDIASRYAELYAVATGVSSPLIGDAQFYKRSGDGSPPQIALGYYVEALANVITYFALHPAFPNTTAVKYLHFADSLSHILNGEPQLLITETAAQAGLIEVNETRTFLLSKIYACRIAQKLAVYKETTSTIKTPTEHRAPIPKAPPIENTINTAIMLILVLALALATYFILLRILKLYTQYFKCSKNI